MSQRFASHVDTSDADSLFRQIPSIRTYFREERNNNVDYHINEAKADIIGANTGNFSESDSLAISFCVVNISI